MTPIDQLTKRLRGEDLHGVVNPPLAETDGKSLFEEAADTIEAQVSRTDQLTQDLATAQAEIANAYAGFRLILEEHYPFANSLVRDDCTNLLASIGNRLNELEALSQPSPALQEYRDMKEDAERYRCLSSSGAIWVQVDVDLDKLMENNNSPDFKMFLDQAVDAIREPKS